MSSDEYRERPDMPRCPECRTSAEVTALDDPHPWANWWCDTCRLAFSGTAAETHRHAVAKLAKKAADEDASEVLRRIREQS